MQILLVAAAITVLNPALAGAQDAVSTYDVVWRAGDSPTADVTAELSAPDCTIRSASKWSTFFEGNRGWAGLMSRFEARDAGGRRLAATPVPGGWRVGAGGPCTVQVRYSVDFSFARRSWEAGNEQVAALYDGGLYTTGLPLFLLGQDGPATVRMRVPDSWLVATPWSETGALTFRVPDQTALLENTLVVGDAYVRTFEAAGFSVTAALLGDMRSGGDAFERAFTRIVPRYVALAAPAAGSRYMFVVFPGAEDGEGFSDSFAVTTGAAPTESNRLIWGNHLSHELLHYWLGRMLAPAPDEGESLQWFVEGFTEYTANLTLAQEHIISSDEYFDILGRRLGNYAFTRMNPNFMEVTPEAAGAHKWRNRPIVYDGGAAIGFCLDTRIRTATNNQRSLETVLRALLARREPLTYAALVTESSAAAGADLSSFFTQHVRGDTVLPLAQCVRDAGFALRARDNDIYLSRAASPSPLATAIQRSYLGE